MPDGKGEHVEETHSRVGKYASWDEPAPPSTTTLVRGLGKPIRWTPRPVREAVQPRPQYHRGRAEALLRLLVNKRANRHAGPQSPKSRRETPAPKTEVRSDGPAPYRTDPNCTGKAPGAKPSVCFALDLTTRSREELL